jgi:hypothetical protein
MSEPWKDTRPHIRNSTPQELAAYWEGVARRERARAEAAEGRVRLLIDGLYTVHNLSTRSWVLDPAKKAPALLEQITKITANALAADPPTPTGEDSS